MSGLTNIHLAVFLFGLSGLLAKFLDLPAADIFVFRNLFAALALGVLIARRRGRLLPEGKKDAPLIALGAVLALHWWSFFYSIQISSIAVGLLTFSSFPMFVVFLEPLLSKKRLVGRDLAAAAAVCAGLALVIPSFDLNDQYALGARWGIVSGFTFALLQVLNRRFVGSREPLRVAFLEIASGCVILFLCTGAAIPAVTGLELALLFFLGVFCTALAHSLFITGLVTVRAETASVIAALEPVYGIALGAAVLGEIPPARTLAGGAVILATVIAMQRRAD